MIKNLQTSCTVTRQPNNNLNQAVVTKCQHFSYKDRSGGDGERQKVICFHVLFDHYKVSTIEFLSKRNHTSSCLFRHLLFSLLSWFLESLHYGLTTLIMHPPRFEIHLPGSSDTSFLSCADISCVISRHHDRQEIYHDKLTLTTSCSTCV